MGELVHDPGLYAQHGSEITPDQIRRTSALSLGTTGCGDCVFANSCEAAKDNALGHYNRSRAGILARWYFNTEGKGAAIDKIKDNLQKQEKAIDAFEEASHGSCAGVKTEQIETIYEYESDEYVRAGKEPFGRIRQAFMRHNSKRLGEHVHLVSVCQNPEAQTVIDTGVDLHAAISTDVLPLKNQLTK